MRNLIAAAVICGLALIPASTATAASSAASAKGQTVAKAQMAKKKKRCPNMEFTFERCR